MGSVPGYRYVGPAVLAEPNRASELVASAGVRTFTFPNVPATTVRVRGTNNAARLTGTIVTVNVNPGSTPTKVKITMRPFGIF